MTPLKHQSPWPVLTVCPICLPRFPWLLNNKQPMDSPGLAISSTNPLPDILVQGCHTGLLGTQRLSSGAVCFFFGTHLFPVGILGNLRKSSFQEVWSIYRFSWKAAKLSQQESSKKAPPPKRTARKKSNVTILDPFLTLPETNIAHESRGKPKEKGSKSNHPFSGAKMLVLRRVPSRELTYPTWGKGKSSSKCHFWGIC